MQYARRGPSSSIHAPHGGDTADVPGVRAHAAPHRPVRLPRYAWPRHVLHGTGPPAGHPADDTRSQVRSSPDRAGDRIAGRSRPCRYRLQLGWATASGLVPQSGGATPGDRDRATAPLDSPGREKPPVWSANAWQLGLTVFPGWSGYEHQASSRRIPVVVLEPTAAAPRYLEHRDPSRNRTERAVSAWPLLAVPRLAAARDPGIPKVDGRSRSRDRRTRRRLGAESVVAEPRLRHQPSCPVPRRAGEGRLLCIF